MDDREYLDQKQHEEPQQQHEEPTREPERPIQQRMAQTPLLGAAGRLQRFQMYQAQRQANHASVADFLQAKIQMQQQQRPQTDAIKQTAATGLQGASTGMPFQQQIQKSFGKHDISNVRSVTGGTAKDANAQMGSLAYASGDAISFKEGPSLHTAAHEAAHIVQQRGGVQLKSGIGQVGDQYEVHADQVADLVVQGKSAEGLLDKYSAGSSSPGIQQKTQKPEPTPKDNQKLEEGDEQSEKIKPFKKAKSKLFATLGLKNLEIKAGKNPEVTLLTAQTLKTAMQNLSGASEYRLLKKELERYAGKGYITNPLPELKKDLDCNILIIEKRLVGLKERLQLVKQIAGSGKKGVGTKLVDLLSGKLHTSAEKIAAIKGLVTLGDRTGLGILTKLKRSKKEPRSVRQAATRGWEDLTGMLISKSDQKDKQQDEKLKQVNTDIKQVKTYTETEVDQLKKGMQRKQTIALAKGKVDTNIQFFWQKIEDAFQNVMINSNIAVPPDPPSQAESVISLVFNIAAVILPVVAATRASARLLQGVTKNYSRLKNVNYLFKPNMKIEKLDGKFARFKAAFKQANVPPHVASKVLSAKSIHELPLGIKGLYDKVVAIDKNVEDLTTSREKSKKTGFQPSMEQCRKVLVSAWGGSYKAKLKAAGGSVETQFKTGGEGDANVYLNNPDKLTRDSMLNHVMKGYPEGFVTDKGLINLIETQGYLNSTFQNLWAKAVAKAHVGSSINRMRDKDPATDKTNTGGIRSNMLGNKGKITFAELPGKIQEQWGLKDGSDLNVKWKDMNDPRQPMSPLPENFEEEMLSPSNKLEGNQSGVRYLLKNKAALIKKNGQEWYDKKMKKFLPMDMGKLKDQGYKLLGLKANDRIDAVSKSKQLDVDLKYKRITKDTYRKELSKLLKSSSLSKDQKETIHEKLNKSKG